MPGNRQLGVAFAVGLVLPLASIAYMAFLDIPFAGGMYESGKYSRPAIELLQSGGLTRDGEPELQRLPGYPLFLAAIYALFGIGNDLAVVLVQAALAAATVVLTGLAASALNRDWFWPAVILAAATPNIGYRASIVLTEPLFLFCVAGAVCAGLWTMYGSRPWLASALSSAFSAMCFMTRPAFLLFPALSAPVLYWALRRNGAISRGHAAAIAVLPIVLCAVVAVPHMLSIQRATGHLTFTTQSGRQALEWVYPCLAARLGCGTPNAEALQRASDRLAAAIAELPADQRNDEVVVDRVRGQLARELLLELPPTHLVVSAIGAAAKMMLHNAIYELNQRTGVESVFFSQVSGETLPQRAANFLSEIAARPWMVAWLAAQLALFGFRGVQAVGMVSALKTPEYRMAGLYLLATSVALAVVTVGLGNPRYRVPLEPMLILLTLLGWPAVRQFVLRLRPRPAAMVRPQ